ncbi:hypothetical protein [Paenibacillus aceti]|uniref:Uncharacterized protein n=1 Tax=Paenibacillus aceti TaxID=1820010 RepID=A0ABQ1W744_9BACL|nr:hypothetical protein [Paenibacillus aceti]GGG15477.1 hypothetical protein GCM10010913_41740 [Paenibacillus aceti]
MKREKEGRIMATQMAATPTLEGRDAQRLLESLKNKPSDRSRQNAKQLISYFKEFENKRK